jgi:hypothetical protein
VAGYAGTGKATLLRENMQVYLWQSERVTVGELSVAFELARVPSAFYPWGLSCEVAFSAAPGTFELDIMGSNNDLAANFVQIGIITAVNANNVGRWDMPSATWPKYVCAFMKTLTNASVLSTLQITR